MHVLNNALGSHHFHGLYSESPVSTPATETLSCYLLIVMITVIITVMVIITMITVQMITTFIKKICVSSQFHLRSSPSIRKWKNVGSSLWDHT